MNQIRKTVVVVFIAAVCFFGSELVFGAPPRKGGVACATIQEALKAGPDFLIQGEYAGTVGGDSGSKIGVQLIALGGGHFQAVFLPGGLPGAGWDARNRIICQGKLDGGKVVFTPAGGDRKYIARAPEQFSAAEKFPPDGQKAYTAVCADGKLTGKTDTGKVIDAAKVLRKSPTLGAKPPAGATVLLAYQPGVAPSLDAWTNTKWKTPDGAFMRNRRSGGNQTKTRFEGPWKLHVEFMSPFQPGVRGQKRGNSGVFPPGGREVQVLDSFGLAGRGNECGGIYKTHRPSVNMCLPPLSWQTYDITYYPAIPAGGGKKASQAYYRVVHNGVTIHERIELGASRKGVLSVQDHGDPVSYRNIWIAKTGAAESTQATGAGLVETVKLARKKAKARQYDYIMDNMLAKGLVDKLIAKHGKGDWRKKFQDGELSRLPYYFGWLKKHKIRTSGDKIIVKGEHGCYAVFVKVKGKHLILAFGQRITSM